MRVRSYAVDPRDIGWEVTEPLYRVYFWNAARSISYEYELADCRNVSEVLAWAVENCPFGHLWEAYIVIPGNELGLGLLQAEAWSSTLGKPH